MTKLISVITPTLNEQDNVEACVREVARVFGTALPGYRLEHIFADNASTDGTVAKLREIARANPHVKVIVNSRNFGAEASQLNAIRWAKGDAVVVMIPADLQDPPSLIPEFVRLWEAGNKVVYGVRVTRDDSKALAVFRTAFYGVLNRIADVPIPKDVGDFRLLDRAVVNALRRFDDRRPFLRGLIASCGFSPVGVPYEMKARWRGKSKMNFARLIGVGLNGLIAFSSVPLRVCLTAGFGIAAASLGYSLVAFVINLIYYREVAAPGIATLIVALFFFGGVQLFFLGVLGEYVLAIHNQVRRGPLVIEAETINLDAPHPGSG